MEADTLHTLVSAAIWRAEELEGRVEAAAVQAWAEVSSLEEALATELPISESEGRIARRGAVRAALKAKDYARAESLAAEYACQDGAPSSLESQLREMLEEDAKAMKSRFRYATKYHDVQEARQIARHFQETGAFGLAA